MHDIGCFTSNLMAITTYAASYIPIHNGPSYQKNAMQIHHLPRVYNYSLLSLDFSSCSNLQSPYHKDRQPPTFSDVPHTSPASRNIQNDSHESKEKSTTYLLHTRSQ